MNYLKETFQCQRDQLVIRGFVLKPDIEGKQPAVIISHGFASNTHHTQKYAEHFAEAGWMSVYFDFCGSGRGKSDGDSEDMSVLTQVEDLSAVLDAVQTWPQVDKNRIVLAGCSQGGLVSALLAAKREAEVERLILFFPAFCIPDDARRGSMLGSKFDPKNVPNTFRAISIKLGAVYVLDAQKLDPYKETGTFQKPVLICHGTHDKLVDYSYVEQAEKAYPNAKLVRIEKGDHGFVLHGFKEAIGTAVAWLMR